MKDKKILFVSGKGGVGKSLIAAAIAYDEAKAGRRVLLVEVGDNSYYKDFWNLDSVGPEPKPLKEMGFDLAMWSGETCLREYVLYYLRSERIYRIFFENKIMRALVNVAPGLSEIAILGKITSGIRKVGPPLEYDLIVVDCYATGHALALLAAPKGLQEAIKFGPMGTHSREIDALLRDQKLVGYVVATLLEELPVTETLEFRDKLRELLGQPSAVVANKWTPLPATRDELVSIEKADHAGLGEFAKYLCAIGDRQDSFYAALAADEKLLALGRVPLILSDDPNRLVREAGEALRPA